MRNHTTTHTQNSSTSTLTDSVGDSAMPGEARRGQGSAASARLGAAHQGVPEVRMPSPIGNTGNKIHPTPTFDSEIIDWLSFTIPYMDIADRDYILRGLVRYFGGAVEAKTNLAHYTNTFSILDNAKIAYHRDRQDMGIHVSLNGASLRMFSEYKNRETSTYAIIIMAKGYGLDTRFTRCDLAIDTQQFTAEDVLEAINEGQLVTYLRKKELRQGLCDTPGCTIYLGSRAGDGRYVRVYDKAAEQGLDDGTVWTRVEIEFKGRMANTLVTYLMLSDCSAEDVIGSTIDFREVGNTRTNNRKQSSWWSDFLGEHKRLMFTPSRAKATIEATRAWVTRSVAPALAFLVSAEGGDYSWLHDEILRAIGRIPAEKQAILQVVNSVVS